MAKMLSYVDVVSGAFARTKRAARRSRERGGNGMPARLPRWLQPCRHGSARPRHQYRRLARKIRSRVASSAPRFASSAIVSTAPIACSTPRFARAGRAKADSRAPPGTKRWSASSSKCSARKRRPAASRSCPIPTAARTACSLRRTSTRRLWWRFGTSRLARTVCAAPTGAANLALYGKMPSVTYQDYPEASLIVLWGINPSASGIHMVPFLRDAQSRGAKLIVVDPRTTPLAKAADIHLAVKPGTDVAVALAIHRHLFASGRADAAFLEAHTRGADALRERAEPWTFEKAADIAGIDPGDLARAAELYATSSPALVRCGWGLERNRNGGNAAMAVLALPAVGGKFGVRGGGYAMSNSASWGIDRTWIDAPRIEHPPRQHESPRARAHRVHGSAGERALRLQLQSGGNGARPAAHPARARARESLHGRVRSGDDRHGALRRRRAAVDDVSRGVRLRQGVRDVQSRYGAPGD